MAASVLQRKSLPLWTLLAGTVLLLAVLSGRPKGSRLRLTLAPPVHDWKVAVGEKDRPVPRTERPAWVYQLDPDRAEVRDGKLVQDLPGRTVTYTLQPKLQRYARKLLQRYQVPYGAAVMVEVRTGRLLVLAGWSSRDPELTSLELCLKAWAPAASVFKLVTAAALLSENKARPQTRVCYHGGRRRLTARHVRPDPKRDQECDTLAGAVAKSLNAIMAKLAYSYLDRETLLAHARRFGFNESLPFLLPVEISRAEIPADPIERAKVAAGFWHTTLSPLHGAVLAQAIANRGIMLQPRLLEAKGRKRTGGSWFRRRVLTEYVAKLLGRMMVMTTTVGTARKAFYTSRGLAYVPWGKVAGKTGSLTRPEPYVDYSWFVGFAPARSPEVAFAVLLGNPPKWRVKAAHVARMLLQAYGRLARKDRARPRTRLRPAARVRPSRPRHRSRKAARGG